MPGKSHLMVSVFQSACGGAAPPRLLEALDAALTRAAGQGSQLLVCPELFLGGYRAGADHGRIAEEDSAGFAIRVARLARQSGVAVVYGYPEASREGCYNSAQAILPGGVVAARHRKTRLPGAYEKQWFVAAEVKGGLTLFEVGGWRIALVICYEVEFPETVRAAARHGADLVVVPTALSSEWPVVARAVVPARAFENGVFLAYANHAGEDRGYRFLGESCIIGPQGQELARAGAEATVISAGLDPHLLEEARRRIPFVADSRGLDSLTPPGV
jgi:predicted amidohydrolase